MKLGEVAFEEEGRAGREEGGGVGGEEGDAEGFAGGVGGEGEEGSVGGVGLHDGSGDEEELSGLWTSLVPHERGREECTHDEVEMSSGELETVVAVCWALVRDLWTAGPRITIADDQARFEAEDLIAVTAPDLERCFEVFERSEELRSEILQYWIFAGDGRGAHVVAVVQDGFGGHLRPDEEAAKTRGQSDISRDLVKRTNRL